jgi:hypothetical protein
MADTTSFHTGGKNSLKKARRQSKFGKHFGSGNMQIAEMKPERVKLIVGTPKEPDSEFVPCTIHDRDSRRLKYQRIPRDQLAVMHGETMGEWMAIWLPTAERWSLIDYVSDMRQALRVVDAA